MSASPRELTRWLDAAHAALETAPRLSLDHVRALLATPERAGRDGSHRRTWWTEEYERVMKAQLRDGFPTTGQAVDVKTWQARQDARTDQLESLADAHADALRAASLAVPRAMAATAATPRRTAADVALDALHGHAA